MRIAFITLLGLTLLTVVIWFLGFLVQEIRGTGEIVIAPVTVIDNEGKGNDELGRALAQMLQARLQTLERELRNAQEGFTTNVRAPALAQTATTTLVGDVRLWTQVVSLQTGLLQPTEMKLSVAGVEVGGMLPWFQRQLSSQRTLHFTIYRQASEAQISGSLAALGVSDEGLRLSVPGQGEKGPGLDAIVDVLAHAIMHRHLARDTTNKLEVLDTAEFTTLAGILVSVDQANRKTTNGRPAQKEFEALIPAITSLADKVQGWPELGYLAARIADSGRDARTALIYYRRVRPDFETAKKPDIVALITARIGELTKTVEFVPATGGPETLPAMLDYSGEITAVRDSGAEGSVVGLAAATALEFQIAKATKESQAISARFIYYAARKLMATGTKIDSGASIKDAITVLSTEGAVAEEVWPYRAGEFSDEPPAAVNQAARFRITGMKKVSMLDELKHALVQNGPVVAGISIFPAAMSPEVSKTGVIPLPSTSESMVGGHAVVIVGYDDHKSRLKFVNSWGASWGEKGFGYLPYEYFTKYQQETWTFQFLPN